jgi:threonyl-tRNA synthetase
VELINDLPEGEVITAYSQGSFTDLCRGPHLPSTKWLRHFKLLNVSGAYFRGDSKREQLQRIYGIAFFTKEELTKYLELVEERKKRDHRRLGKELDLFMISEFGPGFPFWLPNGMILRRNLEEFWYKIHTQAGYQLIQTPIMLDKSLWEISGHWTNYRENMYVAEIDDREFAIKPMNCPGGILVYKRDIHSYKDFPLRLAELGLVHRHEASGALTGLFRVRNFTQDDAHIYLRFDQIVDEVARLIDLFDYVYGIFNLSYHIELSTRPEEKYIGSIEVWNKAEEALADACTKAGHEFKVNPGDGAFYGPKLDFKLRDSMGRIWQCGTIQLDMNLPERFDLHYINDQGEKVRPIMLHRALFGSLERFIGILIEHYAGAFPLWLAPRQIVIVPVNNASHGDYANKLKEILAEQDFRVEVDMRDEKMNYKIREAQTKKIPYTIVVGDKEKDEQLITYRPYGKNESKTLSIAEFVAKLTEEVKTFGKSKE